MARVLVLWAVHDVVVSQLVPMARRGGVDQEDRPLPALALFVSANIPLRPLGELGMGITVPLHQRRAEGDCGDVIDASGTLRDALDIAPVDACLQHLHHSERFRPSSAASCIVHLGSNVLTSSQGGR